MTHNTAHKDVVSRLIDEVMNQGRLEVVDELHTPEMAAKARAWIKPFLESFSDINMRIVDLVAEDDTVAARFSCSGTHTGEWLGKPASGLSFHDVDEVYFFTFEDGLIADAWGIEDTAKRKHQLS
ncbi:MAG: hypothetical protein GEU79_17490 [Acidimicrobiia bacterium]|nr:hypothetical protein [Acidimicrobiia bacterium]